MFKQIIFSLLMFSLCCNTFGLRPRSTFAASQLADVILRSTYSLEENPQRTADCFALYMPQITATTKQYEDSYNGCLNATTVAEDNLKKQVQGDIDTIENISNGICIDFKSCSNNSDLYKLFNCYYVAANATRQSAFEIQNVSKSKMQYVEITQENIAYTETECTDTCSRIYETQMEILYDNLKLCLDGKPVPTKGGTTIQPNKNPNESTVPTTTVDIETDPTEDTTSKDSSLH
ncbi:hypothetical protein DOY81_009495 [Sarcophaga bullata]|nr:hypothetical protein DOY81_009495 [Sarcophaga bullata]